MHPSPSLAEWLSLLALWDVVAYVVLRHHRRRPRGPQGSPDVVSPAVQHVLSALSVVPIVVAFGVGAGWLTIAWWTLLALPARRALLVVFVPPAVALARRGEWRDEPHDPQQRRIVACVLGLAMAAVLTGLATAVLLSPSGRWAIAAGLAIGCGLAHAAYALVRRWTPPPGEREQATVA